MKKLLFGLVLLLGIGIAGKAEAASARGGSRHGANINYSTTVSSVSVGPAALYQVILSSGASSEYVAFYDAATNNGISATGPNTSLKTRVFYSSTSANTVVTFDPPLQFNLGLYAVGSAITGQATIVFERGRPIGN